MKKNLIILAVLSMYVFLCGCPFESTTQVKFGTPANLNPQLFDLNITGKMGQFSQIPVNFKLTRVVGGGTNVTIITPETTTPPPTYSCTFGSYTITNLAGTVIAKDTIMDLLVNQPTNFHYFVVIQSKNPTPNIFTVDLLPLPSIMTIAGASITDADIQTYLTSVENKIPPILGDSGYDGDTEIRTGITGGFAPPLVPGGGTYQWSTPNIIV